MSKGGKIKRNSESGRFIIGRAAAKKIGEVEGYKMSASMNGMFVSLDRSNVPPESRRAQLAAKYSSKK